MSLPHLPAELQNLIIANLHPTAAIALGQTNHHYHSTVSLHLLVLDTVHEFIYGLEGRSAQHGSINRSYACYTCLSMKPGTLFKLADEYQDKYGRQCMECEAKNGSVTVGWVYPCYSKGNWVGPSLVCTECFKASSNFCEGCRICARCLGGEHGGICTYCGWCGACVGITMVEWESRKESHRVDHLNQVVFEYHFKRKETCKHRFPGDRKALDTGRTLKKTDAAQTEDRAGDKERECTSAKQQQLQIGGKGNASVGKNVEDADEGRYKKGHSGEK